jgi:hypothetical protein
MLPVFKYAGWADADAAKALKEQLTACGIAVHEARNAVCTPLAQQIQVGIVVPETWRQTQLCKRPLSWYWASPLAGRFLIISAMALDSFGFPAQIVLRKRCVFRPPLLPDESQQRRMIQRPSYLAAKPEMWDRLDDQDVAEQQRWMRVMGIRRKRFEDLFVTHCANHANFIEPEYFIEQDGEQIPYSIGPTNQVCSACLEFFNVIGGRFRYKLVVPCPGAAIYAGMPVNRYIEVETLRF